jgi:hypothetical protein
LNEKQTGGSMHDALDIVKYFINREIIEEPRLSP